MANVSFAKGNRASLPEEYVEGRFLVTLDEHAIYLDVDGESRIRLGDFVEVEDMAALEEVTSPVSTALYYVKELNVLAKHDGASWKQINPDTGATKVSKEGEGNAVTDITYDAASRTLKLVMGTYTTGTEVDEKIAAKVGDLGDQATVKAYVDEKTKGIASESEITDIQDRLDTIEGEAETEGSIKKALSDANAYTDTKNTAMDTRVKAVEEAKHTHENAEELAKIAAGDKDKWDGAATDTAAIKKDYLKTSDKTELQESIDTKQDTLVFNTPYDGSTNKAATMADVTSAVSGLSGAMHWKGTVEEKPTPETGTDYAEGDVVTYEGVEYAWDGEAWQELGDESKYSGKVAGWDAAAEKAHEHTNKTELDKIADGDKAKWDAAATKADANEEAITAIKDGESVDSFKDVEDELAKKATTASVEALVGTEESITASTIKEAAKEAENYAVEQDTALKTALVGTGESAEEDTIKGAKKYTDEALTWGSF